MVIVFMYIINLVRKTKPSLARGGLEAPSLETLKPNLAHPEQLLPGFSHRQDKTKPTNHPHKAKNTHQPNKQTQNTTHRTSHKPKPSTHKQRNNNHPHNPKPPRKQPQTENTAAK